jgi:hypothetical protein
MEMLKMIRKLGLVLTVTILVALLFVTAEASSGSTLHSGRRIAIVLDNSGSMIINGSSRWAEATYALRTFLCMVDDNDQIGLFTVDKSPDSDGTKLDYESAAPVSNDLDKNNIDKELEKVGISVTTSTHGLHAAYKWVKEKPSAEKWVVILSDGAFIEKTTPLSFEDSIVNPAKEGGKSGIQTIFIGLELNRKQVDDQANAKKKIDYDNFLSDAFIAAVHLRCIAIWAAIRT